MATYSSVTGKNFVFMKINVFGFIYLFKTWNNLIISIKLAAANFTEKSVLF